jgi:hypothetical protein
VGGVLDRLTAPGAGGTFAPAQAPSDAVRQTSVPLSGPGDVVLRATSVTASPRPLSSTPDVVAPGADPSSPGVAVGRPVGVVPPPWRSPGPAGVWTGDGEPPKGITPVAAAATPLIITAPPSTAAETSSR